MNLSNPPRLPLTDGGRLRADANLDVALAVLFIWLKINGTLTISWWWIVMALFV